MYAVVRQGNHQYRVSPGDIIQIELVDASKGDSIVLEDVLLLNSGGRVEVGEPRLGNVEVKARVLREGKGEKVRIYKFRRRKGYSKSQGHRQRFTEIMITGVARNGSDLSE
jgi:large subunit ribosomal protein L21